MDKVAMACLKLTQLRSWRHWLRAERPSLTTGG